MENTNGQREKINKDVLRVAGEIPVDLNSLASRVFLADEEWEYKKEDMPETGRFIVLKRNLVNRGYFVGYCIIHDKEHGILLYIEARYLCNGSWEEVCRYAFYKEGERVWFAGGIMPNGTKSSCIDCEVGVFDICGQTVIREEHGKKYALYTTETGAAIPYCQPSGACEELFSFFKGDVFIENTCWQDFTRVGLEDDALFERLSCGNDDEIISADEHKRGNGENYFDEVLPPLPEEAYRAMREYSLLEMHRNVKLFGHGRDAFLDYLNLCVLQKVDGVLWERTFSPYVIYRYPEEDSDFKFVETTRRDIKEYSLDDDRFDALEDRLLDTSIPVYADCLDGTYIQHAKILLEWLEKLKDVFALKTGRYDAFSDLKKYFYETYFINANSILRAADVIAKVPVAEMMYNADFDGEKKLRRFLMNNINCNFIREEEDISEIVGVLYAKDSLWDILGVPKYLAGRLADINLMEGLKYLKLMFHTEEARKYLRNINKEDAELLADIVRHFFVMLSTVGLSAVSNIVRKMFSIYGHKNWKAYFDYMEKEDIATNKYSSYGDYITMLYAIGEPVRKEPWNIKMEDIPKKMNKLEAVYLINREEARKRAVDQNIADREKEMAALCYEDSCYCMRYPKCSDDIVKEGSALHHCASEFVGAVMEGLTTLLFIRKKEKPDKPFYTLEIRGGAIRQCHGNNNCSVCEEEGLEEFLKEFCKEKGIRYQDPDSMRGA